MCPAHIAFSTPKKLKFTWTDTFEDVKDAELEQLIIECRSALHSLEAELAARQSPRVDTKLEDCYARLQEKARTIKHMGALSNKDRASLEEAGTFLKALRSGHIDSSQTRETRKGGAMYEQLLWLISRVAGPAYALLLICGVARRTVERLNSFQSAVLVKHMARYYDSLSSRALEEKANEFGLYTDATSPIQRVSGKRKRGQSDSMASSIAWTDSVSVSSNESSPSKICDSSRQVKQKMKVGVNLLNSYYPGEVNGLTKPETDFNNGILTPNSNTSNEDDKNANSTVPGNDIDCGAVVQPQNQVAAFSQPSLRSDDRLQDCNWPPANGAIFKDAGSRLLVCENGAHDFDGTDFMTDSTINSVILSTQCSTDSKLSFTAGGGENKDNSGRNRPKGAVCFNQKLAQPVVNPTTTLNNAFSRPEEHTMEPNSIPRDCNPASLLQAKPKSKDGDLHHPSSSKTQHRPRSPTLLSSLEYSPPLPNSAPSQNSSDEWEKLLINDCTKDTTHLSLLLHAMGGFQIPGLLLDRALWPQRRWNASGIEHKVTAVDAGLDPHLLDILSDTDRRMQAVEPVVKSNTTNGSWTLSLEGHFQSRISRLLGDQEKEKWSIEALKWICFVFPRDQLWESQPSFASVVKLLLTPLDHTLQGVKQRSVATRVRNEALETLLIASKVGSLQSRRDALTMATQFLDDESSSDLHAEMAHQQSNLSRLAANFVQSERFIHDFCYRCGCRSDQCIPRFYRQLQPEQVSNRLNTLYGRLHGSHLENLVQCEQYSAAIEEVDDWRTSKPSSLMECRVLPSRAITIAKIYRSQGLFTDARSRLESCLITVFPQDTIRCQVLCSLADVYCDLRLPDKAHKLLIQDIEKERKKVSKTKPFRRLLVTLIDTDIQRCRYDNAINIIAELGDTFNHLSNLDVSDQLLHVRTLVASARLCHYKSEFHEALQRWEVALIHVQKYKSFEGEGFTYAIIHFSISLAHLESGDVEEAQEAFKRAEIIWSKGTRDFWIPTLAAWGQLTVLKIRALTGWGILDLQKA